VNQRSTTREQTGSGQISLRKGTVSVRSWSKTRRPTRRPEWEHRSWDARGEV
jgi:hypothetical protein